MIVCSCNVISDRDIETALIEILSQPEPPLPTPGVVWRHLASRMRCCGCAPLAVDTIYAKMDKLEAEGLISADTGRIVRDRLSRRTQRKLGAATSGAGTDNAGNGDRPAGRRAYGEGVDSEADGAEADETDADLGFLLAAE